MITLALDASTKCTGWSLMNNGQYVDSGVIDMNKDPDSEHRIAEMTREICKLIHKYDPDKVFLEDTVQMANAKAYKSLCWLAGGIRYWCYRNDYDVEMILPTVWRKHVHIQETRVKRAELKRRAMELCKEQFDLDVSEDRAEAILINFAMAIRDKIIEF